MGWVLATQRHPLRAARNGVGARPGCASLCAIAGGNYRPSDGALNRASGTGVVAHRVPAARAP